MLAGLTASSAALIALGFLPELLGATGDADLLTPELGALAALGLPLGFAAALLGGRAGGFPLALRRSAITCAALLATTVAGLVPLLAWREAAHAAGLVPAALGGYWLLLLAAPPLVAAHRALRRRLIARLFRDDYDLPDALRALGAGVVGLDTAGAIADHALPRLVTTLDLAWARLRVRAPDGRIVVLGHGEAADRATPTRGVPLVARGEAIGALELGPKRRGLALRREDAALADILAPLLAAALRNARLLAALRAERAALAARERALAALGRRLTEVAEDERRRLARDLHDVALAELGALRREVERAAWAHPEATDMAERLAQIGEDVRGIIADLRPPELELGGLGAALRGLVPTTAARLGLELRPDLGDMAGERWEPALELALYRAVQEGLANAARHGRAGIATVSLRRCGARLTLTVADDGGGERDSAALPGESGGLGLLGMRERLEPWGGTVALARRAAGGTTLIVTAIVPGDPGTSGVSASHDACDEACTAESAGHFRLSQ